MPLYTTDALILRTYKLGESDRIVVFLTRDRGKKRGVAKNARQSRRRFGGALEPLTCGRVGYVERERRDLVQPRLRGAAAVAAVGGRRRGARATSSYFAELIDEWAPEARSERDAVPARRIDGGRDGRGRADRAAGALLRVLAAAAAGRVRAPTRGCRTRRGRFCGSARDAQPARASATLDGGARRRCVSSKRRIGR